MKPSKLNFYFSFIFLSVLLLGQLLESSIFSISSSLLIVISLAIYTLLGSTKANTTTFLLIFIAIGFSLSCTRNYYENHSYSFHQNQHLNKNTLHITLLSSLKPLKRTHAAIARISNSKARVQVLIPKTLNFNAGDTLSLSGKFVKIESITNHGQWNKQLWLKNKNLIGTFKADTAVLKYKSNWLNIRYLSEIIRYKLYSNLLDCLPKSYANLLFSLIFGDSIFSISEETKTLYKKVGLSHLLVVSGSQVSLLSGSIFIVLRRFTKNNSLIQIITLSINIIFYFITGGGASILRAIIFFQISCLLKLNFRKTTTLHELSLCAIIMILIYPRFIFDKGAQLSFAATTGLLFISPKIQEKLKQVPPIIGDAFSIAVGPFLTTTPIIMSMANFVSLHSLVANMIAVPVCEVLVIFGFIGCLLGLVLPLIDTIIFNACWATLVSLNYALEQLIKMPIPSFFLRCNSVLAFSLIGTLFLGIYSSSIKVKKLCVITQLIIYTYIIFFPHVPRNFVKITFIDVGQGDAILIDTPQRYRILIDSGNTIGIDHGKYTILPTLRFFGINKLDLAVISHFDKDHYGGFESIIKTIPISNFLINDSAHKYPTWTKNKINQIPRSIINAPKLSKIEFSKDFTLYFFYPTKNQNERKENNNSIVCLVQYKEFQCLLTGDLEKKGEKSLIKLAGNILNCDVIQAGHHGSKTSSHDELLRATTPKASIISLGKNNRYGHPHTNTLDRLQKHVSEKLFRTDIHGAITIKSNGKTASIKTFNGKDEIYLRNLR